MRYTATYVMADEHPGGMDNEPPSGTAILVQLNGAGAMGVALAIEGQRSLNVQHGQYRRR